MKTSQEVYMNFRATQEVIQDLRGIARDTHNVANQDVGEALRQVKSAWQGENADAFLTKGSRLQSNIHSTADAIENLAQTLEQIAQNTYKAEMEAIRIAQQH